MQVLEGEFLGNLEQIFNQQEVTVQQLNIPIQPARQVIPLPNGHIFPLSFQA